MIQAVVFLFGSGFVSRIFSQVGGGRNSLFVVQCWVRVTGLVDCPNPDETGGLKGDPDHYSGPGATALGTPFCIEELAEDDY